MKSVCFFIQITYAYDDDELKFFYKIIATIATKVNFNIVKYALVIFT